MKAVWGYHLYVCFAAFVLSSMLGFLGILAEHRQLAWYKYIWSYWSRSIFLTGEKFQFYLHTWTSLWP